MPADFNLETNIASWKQELAARLRDPEAADELETHLRELVAAALASGLSPEAAWGTAVAKTGDVKSLQREFAKLERGAWLDAAAVVAVGMTALGLVLPFTQKVFFGGAAGLQADRLLAIHVFTIAIGYIGALTCGMIGAYAVLRLAVGGVTNRVVRRWIPGTIAVACGVTAALMIVGVVLGAVWSSEHLGRAWGWDPKEIGGTVTALFHASIFLLAVKGRISGELLLALASVGASLTLFAWFGPAALGLGQHAYGIPAYTLLPLLASAGVSIGITVLAVRRSRATAGH